ncbi:MAG: class I SAM-dependent methyltransferase [Armatimonadetes bacterium]|nr:class I SAM-dependent methyltransferase [Armatimonadota bacterium]
MPPPPLLRADSTRVTYCTTASFAEHGQQYDIILLRHVLEHAHYPLQLLRGLRERLTEDGILCIEVPNLHSGCARLFGKHWKNYYVPRHIYHFTANSLREIAQLAGLDAQIGRNSMPLMGNTIALLTGLDKTNVLVQAFGVLFHPFQLIVERLCKSSTCINARCQRHVDG